jgi:hypothetical protein
MPASFPSRLFQPALGLALTLVVAVWWLTVPGLMTSSTFVALFGILGASGWVLKSAYENARPASSLAQSLHDVETTAALKRPRRSSGEY